MHKIANEVTFANQQMVERTFSRMRDEEYADTIATLSAIHELLAQQPEYNVVDATKEVIGDNAFVQGFARYITHYIGEGQFKSISFDSLSKALHALRPQAVSPEQGSETESEGVQEVGDGLNRPDFSAEIERVKAQDYPEDEQERVDIAFVNLDLHLDRMMSANNESDIELYAEQLGGTIQFLDSLVVYTPLGEESDEVEPEKKKRRKRGSKVVKAGETDLSDEDVESKRSTRVLLADIPATLDMESFLSHPITRGIELVSETGLTAESLPQTSASLDQIMKNAEDGFIHFSGIVNALVQKHSQTIDENGGNRVFKKENFKVDKNILVDFNNLIYAIKGVDIFVKRAIRTAIADPEKALSGVELADLRNKLLVPRFTANEAFFRTNIMLPLSYLTVRDVGLLFAGVKTWEDFPKGEIYRGVVEDYAKDILGGRDLVADTQESIFNLMWSKFKRQLAANSADMTVNVDLPMKNFLGSVSFLKDFVAMNLRRSIRANGQGKVSVVKCPTCTRPIKWAGKPLKEVDLIQSRGAYLPMYSFIGQRENDDGKNQSFIITERHLAEGGPYPPPDPSKIGSESQANETRPDGTLKNKSKLIRRTRSVIESYEGSKTWPEILEMIYSNEPSLHEEGLHRRAGALAHLGAIQLRHKRDGSKGVPVVRDISSIMYACPFQKEEARTGDSQSGVFDLKAELNTVRNELTYPEDPETQQAKEEIFSRIEELNLAFSEAAMSGADLEEIQGSLESAFDQAHDLAGSVRNEPEEEQDEGPSFSASGCGLKLSPYDNGTSDMSYGSNANPTALQYTWNPREFSEAQEAAAQQKMSGGYKFSKTIFRCPARIINPSSSDLVKYKNVAIPKAGPVGAGNGAYVPPTNAEGYAAYDEIQEGTFSYLVCGTSTSISAFDKTSNGEGSIYTILRNFLGVLKGTSTTGEKVTNSQKVAAKDIIDFLILEGIDYMDVLKALEIADAPEPELETTARLKKCRMKKIENMLVTAARQLPSQFAEIESLVLVCPHGHRFSIKQSVGFSESHSSVKMSGVNRGYAAAKELYSLTGFASLEAAKRVGVIVMAAEDEELKTFDQIGSDNHSTSEIAFIIPDESGAPVRWKFSPNIADLIKKNAFSQFPGAGHEDIPTAVEFSKVTFGGQFLADLVNDSTKSGSGNDEELGAGKQVAAQFRRDEEGGGEALSRAIEGIDSKDLAGNIEALARGLRGVLKIVITWNNRAIEPEFFNKVVASSDFSVDGISEQILSIPGLFYVEDGDDNTAAFAAVETAFVPRLKSYVVATNAFQGKDYMGSAIALATAALVDAVEQVGDATEHLLEFDLDLDSQNSEFEFVFAKLTPFFESFRADFEKLIPYITHDDERYVAKAQEIASQNPVLSVFYAIASYQTEKKGQERTRLREAYGKKIFLVAYARYLANSIAVVYNECMAPGRSIPGAFIGYDIGVDLSTTDKVLALTAADIRMIEDNPKLRGANQGIVLRNVVAAYNSVIGRMSIARNMAISPIGLAEAKKELLRQAGASNDPLAHATFSAAFPMQTVDFGMEHLTYGSGNVPNSFGIRAGKGRALPSEPAVLPPAMLPVTRSDGSPVLDRTGVQKQIPAYLHPDSGFDSSKFQIGMCMGKTGKSLTWPLNHANDFVGFPLPFNRDKTATVTRAAEAPVYDFRFVVDIEGTPQDISFLFRRGKTEQQVSILRTLYSKLDALEEQRGDALEELPRLKLVGGEISEQEDAINNHFDDAVREVQSALRQIPLHIKAGKSYVRNKASLGSDTPKWISEAHPTALLVSPSEALNLVDNVERFAGMLSTEPNPELLTRFVVKVFGLDVVRDIVQEAQDKFTDDDAELDVRSIFDTYIDKDTPAGKKMLAHINSSLTNVYSEHLGQFYDLLPSGADGSGSNLVLLEASIPSFKTNKRSESGFQVIPDDGLGTPPSIGKLASRLNRNNAVSDFFGHGLEGDSGSTYLQKAQESMIEYVRSHASGELGAHTTEASLKTEYLKKIAKRRKSWERMMLTMGEPDIEVDDLVG